ncbi:ankyrin repeat domain-containing protein [Gemmata sp.]|uniref:ankyrin repeat domain-containing protein n=1 Tax=Gemmata sp. TaxID=1914242 RepID=UPI003F709B67
MTEPFRSRALVVLAVSLAFAGSGHAGEIHDLLRKGELDKVKGLLARNAELKGARDDLEQTPLHVAAHYGHAEIVKLLLEQGADVNARAYNEFAPLHLTESPEVVKLLIAHKADVDAEAGGETALQRAAGRLQRADKATAPKWAEIVKSLRGAGARYDILSATYLNDLDRVRAVIRDDPQAVLEPDVMRVAARCGRAAIVKLLLDHKADPNDPGNFGLPALYDALEHPDVVRVLIAAGADVKTPLTLNPKPGFGTTGQWPEGTLLHHAALKGYADTVRLLVAAGAEVDARHPRRGTPLQFAASGGWPEVVKLLLKRKASVRGEDGTVAMAAAASRIYYAVDYVEKVARYKSVIATLRGEGVPVNFHAAVALGDLDEVKKFLKEKPELAASNTPERPGGKPALAAAVVLDHREIVAALLDAGAPIEAGDDGGNTPLHWAARLGREEIAKVLLARRAAVNARDKDGLTPLHAAAGCGKSGVARILLAAGADVNAKDHHGWTPLAWVRKNEEAAAELTKLFKMHGGR